MYFYAIVIPVAVYLIASAVNRRYNVRNNTLWLGIAAVLFSVSIFLPSPQIQGIDTEFWTHFFGGGFFMGILYIYFRPLVLRVCKIKELRWYHDVALLFMLTSAFGVVNELYELFAQQVRIHDESLEDTSWDLLANTLGLLSFYVAYRCAKAIKSLFISR